MYSPQKRMTLQKKIDELEKRIMSMNEQICGYGDDVKQVRSLIGLFKFYDHTQSGMIDFPDFLRAMVRFNFIAIEREIRSLFNRYDEYRTGYMNYVDFANDLFGKGDYKAIDDFAKSILYEMRDDIQKISGTFGLFELHQTMIHGRCGANYKVDLDDLYLDLKTFGLTKMDGEDLMYLLEFFIPLNEKKVNVKRFFSILTNGMSMDRKKLVLTLFSRIERRTDGVVTLRDIRNFYQPVESNRNPEIPAGESLNNLILHMEAFKRPKEENVIWEQFLDYYRCLSVCVEDDHTFDLLVRGSWVLPYHPDSPGATAGDQSPYRFKNFEISKIGVSNSPIAVPEVLTRRVLVVHFDGSEEVVEFQDELGVTRFDPEYLTTHLTNMGIENIKDIHI